MLPSPAYDSDHRDDRRLEKQAGFARSSTNSRNSDPNKLPRRNKPGRDDIIFADDISPARRRPSGRDVQSPSGPVQALKQRVDSRRTASSVVSPASIGKPLGVREAGDHIDKLSKENFDLKFEVYHRREKAIELEKKLSELSRYEEDNAELLQINEDLLQELDKRDVACDQAVALAWELEEEVEALRSQLRDTRKRPAGREAAPFASDGSDTTHRPEAEKKKPRQDPRRLSVSQEVSARMAEISTPRQPTRHVPSFLDNDHSATRTLRSQYMDGHRQIRPIPSFTTIGSQSLANEEQRLFDTALLSPAISEISESEFKSLYGRNDGSDSLGDETNTQHHLDSPAIDSASERLRHARTDKWVNDSKLQDPPSRQSMSSRTSRGSLQPEQFQSLGGILHSGAPVESSGIQVNQEEQRANKPRSHEDARYEPSIAPNLVYGQNLYPPTPDTMLTRETRPSTQSSSSVIATGKREGQFSSSHGLDSRASQENDVRPQNSGLMRSRSSLLPETPNDNALNQVNGGDGPTAVEKRFEPAPIHAEGYVSDDAVSTPQARRRPAKPHRELSLDPDILRQSSPTESSLSPPSSFTQPRSAAARSREPRQVHGASVVLEDRPLPRRRSISATPTQQTFLEAGQATDKELLDAVRSPKKAVTPQKERVPRAPQADPTRHRIANPDARPVTPDRLPIQVPNDDQAPPKPPAHVIIPTRSSSKSSTARPTDSLRQRVSKFARRNSNSTPARPTSEATSDNSFHTPPSAPVQSPASNNSQMNSLSLRTRNFFHRRRSSASQRSSPSSPTQPRRKITQSNGEDDIAAKSRSNTFMDAAKAAMPHLDMVGNERKTPAKGISTGIPILSTPQNKNEPVSASSSANRSRPHASSKTSHTAEISSALSGGAQGVGFVPSSGVTTATAEGRPLSPTMDKGRRGSNSRGFPRRGRGGEVAASQRPGEGQR